MRIVIVVIASLTLVLDVYSGEILLWRMTSGGTNFSFYANYDHIVATPSWTKRDAIPLSHESLLKIVESNDKIASSIGNDYELISIELSRVIQRAVRDKWIYTIQFAHIGEHGYSSLIRSFVVLMDGTVIDGKVTEVKGSVLGTDYSSSPATPSTRPVDRQLE
ncbi:MAG: hypothetical protein M5U15_02535 [Kiritimatiellae bacterium]|nr:hypothetical protein [Kiritimatiellia bacterium]